MSVVASRQAVGKITLVRKPLYFRYIVVLTRSLVTEGACCSASVILPTFYFISSDPVWRQLRCYGPRAE